MNSLEQTTQGRPDAAAAIWNWRAEEEGATPSVGRRAHARLRGSLQAVLGVAVGAAIFTFLSEIAGTVVMTIASAIFLAAMLSPSGLYALVERAFEALGQLLGRILTRVTLTSIFYLLFLPFGLLFRRGTRDPMKRRYEPEAASYWTEPKRGRSGSASRERQY